MHATLFWPALTLIAGGAVSIPLVENAANRSVLYWIVLPPIAVGLLTIFSHVNSF